MANGVLIFEGMKVGVQPGDLQVHTDESGAATGHLILSTAYNVLPLWLQIANEALVRAKAASAQVASVFNKSEDEIKRRLLVAELGPSMEVAVACGIALDALYDVLRPHAKLSHTEITKWRSNKTKRSAQIAEVIKRVYKIKNNLIPDLRQKINDVTNYRDKAVHPSFKLERACDRADIEVGVDWKFSLYRYSNAQQCFVTSLTIVAYLCENKSTIADVNDEMERIEKALVQLNLVKRNVAIKPS